ncbi:hypothetical protein MBCUT_15900 [Methanobrevibacter cuticularis]|uniref:Uncharacterized protein n=1 Tax=Methanobrevibacter cuticularis TaxID=47311 RepID=A0A166D6V5_9EURY|nr:hypothetical protein [Methanobrevibacter cuticularis]KZX15265.1 hypothetical protein MBCUT_15900 [Methanobrevibacter cuticularis]
MNRDGYLSVSHQTIENIILSTETPNEIPLDSSGKYTFDVLWSKAQGGWNCFYFCITDAISKKVVYDDLYDKKTAENLDKFFKEISSYLPEEKYITVDLKPKYKKLLEKHGFKRQLSLKHAPSAINNRLKSIINKFKKKGGKITKIDKKNHQRRKTKNHKNDTKQQFKRN